jgi:hypothetical protein
LAAALHEGEGLFAVDRGIELRAVCQPARVVNGELLAGGPGAPVPMAISV